MPRWDTEACDRTMISDEEGKQAVWAAGGEKNQTNTKKNTTPPNLQNATWMLKNNNNNKKRTLSHTVWYILNQQWVDAKMFDMHSNTLEPWTCRSQNTVIVNSVCRNTKTDLLNPLWLHLQKQILVSYFGSTYFVSETTRLFSFGLSLTVDFLFNFKSFTYSPLFHPSTSF